MYNNLQGEMKKAGITREDIRNLLDLGKNTIWLRFNSEKHPFDLNEAQKIRNKFFPDMKIDDLFI